MANRSFIRLENTTNEAQRLDGRGDTIWIAPNSRLRVDPWFAERLPAGVSILDRQGFGLSIVQVSAESELVSESTPDPITKSTLKPNINPINQSSDSTSEKSAGVRRNKKDK